MTKVSVCIPVYGVEKYIERCARSLFEQTVPELEFVFVNDCTPDKSIEVLRQTLEDYPHRKSQVTIIDLPENRGLVNARNVALEYLAAHGSGEYIIHCDSDDYVEPDMYERMYERAVAHDADMVYCDYFAEFQNSGKVLPLSGGTAETVDEMIKELFSRFAPMFLWNKMFRRNIALKDYSQFCPVDVCYLEDGCRVFPMLCNCGSAVHCHGYFYHYRLRRGSMSDKLPESVVYQQNIVDAIAIWDARFTEEKYRLALDYRRRQALYMAMSIPGFSAKKWRSLYNSAKKGIWHDCWFPLPLKLVFALTTVNFTCGVLVYRILRFIYRKCRLLTGKSLK